MSDISDYSQISVPNELYRFIRNKINTLLGKTAIIKCGLRPSAKFEYFQVILYADEVASILLRLELDKGKYIGIFMDEPLILPSVILGIWQLGYAFICLNTNGNKESNLKLIEKLGIQVLLANSKDPSYQETVKLLSMFGTYKENVSGLGEHIQFWKVHESKYVTTAKPNSVLFAIQSSGSTGEPKLIKVKTESIMVNIKHLSSVMKIKSSDIIYFGTPLTFDPCMIELLLALINGAALFVVPSAVRVSPELLLDALFPVLLPSRVTIIQMTPSIFLRWSVKDIQNRVFGKFSSLRALMLGGEPCPPISTIRQWKPSERVNIYNLYGITEVSCWATIQLIQPAWLHNHRANKVIPLGEPFPRTMLVVRSDSGSPISEGEGELYIGSTTRVCFIDDEKPSEVKLPVFRPTGDIVKVNRTHGYPVYEFLCRKLNAIKKWGHHVNINKLEQMVMTHESVRKCCFIVEQGRSQLMLLIELQLVPKSYSEIIQQIRHILVRMGANIGMPESIRIVKNIPLTLHGKVDYEQLKKKYHIPRSMANEMNSGLTLPELLKNAWAELLGVSPSQKSVFLEQGGNSVTALQVMNIIQESSRKPVPHAFIPALLSGASYSQCCTILQNGMPDEVKKGHSALVPMKRKTIEFSLPGPSSASDAMSDVSSNGSSQAKKPYLSITDEKSRVTSIMNNGSYINFVTDLPFSFDLNSNDCTLSVDWRFHMERCVDASPSCVTFGNTDGLVVVGSHAGCVAALEPGTGKEKFVLKLADRILSSVCFSFCGTFCFLGCMDHFLYCICLKSGKVVWQFRTGEIIKCSPKLTTNGQEILIGSYDGYLYCVNIKDGQCRWRSNSGKGSIYASPCISTNYNLIYVGLLNGVCQCISEADGSVIWQHKLPSSIFASPCLIRQQECILFGEVSGLIHCFCSKTGTPMWAFQAAGNLFSSFTTLQLLDSESELIAYGCHDKNLYCLIDDGSKNIKLLWKIQLDSALFSTPFMFSSQSNNVCFTSLVVLCASTDGNLYLLRVKDGSIITQHTLPKPVFSSPCLWKNKIIIGCRDNFLYCININC